MKKNKFTNNVVDTKYVCDLITDYDELSQRSDEIDTKKENALLREIVLALKDKIAEDRISKERPDGHSLQRRRLTPATIRASSYFYECYLYEQKYGEDKMKNKYFDAIIIDRHQNNKNRFSDCQCWKSAFGL